MSHIFYLYTCQINNVCPQNHIKYTFQIYSNTIAFDTSYDNQQINFFFFYKVCRLKSLNTYNLPWSIVHNI
jgi:hypothetical protein